MHMPTIVQAALSKLSATPAAECSSCFASKYHNQLTSNFLKKHM